MSSLLSQHLEQIKLCSQSISELPFPGRRQFANAILAGHDITALIRDTEPHERALFHLAPPPITTDITSSSHGVAPISSAALKSRRTTMHRARQPRSKAVAAVLGGQLYSKLQSADSRQVGEADIDLLLQGAERLANVYPVEGALEKIAQFKRRHTQVQANIAHYEARLAEQSIQLGKMRSTTALSSVDPDNDDYLDTTAQEVRETDPVTIQEEIDDLERKKKSLEDRVTGMEKDLGGLLR